MRIDVNIPVDEGYDTTPEWANYPPGEDTPGGLGTVEIEFYDAETEADGGDYIDCTFCEDVEQKDQIEFTLTQCGKLEILQPHFVANYIGNNFLISNETIETEFGSDPNWDRRPLPFVLEEDRDDDKRWDQTEGKFNLRAELLKGEDAVKKDCSPDLVADNENKGGKIKTQVSPNKIIFNNIIPGKYGLHIEEIGNKTICHYVHREGDTAKYCIDWLENIGLLFPTISTIDEQIKITAEPSFDADIIDGKILRVLGGTKTKVKVFWMPRHWAYYARLATLETEDVITSHSISFSAWFDEGLIWHYNSPSSTGLECDHGFFYSGPYNGEIMYDDAHPYGIPGSHAYEKLVPGNYPGEKYSNGDGIGVSGCSGSWSSDGPAGHFEGTGSLCKIWIESGLYEGATTWSGTINYELTVSRPTYTHYVGLWWDRWPGSLNVLREPVNGPDVNFHKQWNPPEIPNIAYSLVGDESKDDAIQKLIDLGVEEQEASEIIIGGQNSIHYLSQTVYMECRTKIAYTLHYAWGANWSCPDMKPIITDECDPVDFWAQEILENSYAYGYTPREDLFLPIWERITNSSYWEQYEQFRFVANDGYLTDDVPFGVGISPNKAGMLLAVVKVGSKRFYVWQKTDEEFTERRIAIDGDYGGHYAPFEPSDGTQGRRDNMIYTGGAVNDFFIGEHRKLTHMLPSYTVSCTVHPAFGWFEDLPETGQNHCWTQKSEEGHIELEMPVYVMASRERALYNGYRVLRELVQPGYYVSFGAPMRNAV